VEDLPDQPAHLPLNLNPPMTIWDVLGFLGYGTFQCAIPVGNRQTPVRFFTILRTTVEGAVRFMMGEAFQQRRRRNNLVKLTGINRIGCDTNCSDCRPFWSVIKRPGEYPQSHRLFNSLYHANLGTQEFGN